MVLPDGTAIADGMALLTDVWNAFPLLLVLVGLAAALIVGRSLFGFVVGLLRGGGYSAAFERGDFDLGDLGDAEDLSSGEGRDDENYQMYRQRGPIYYDGDE